MILHINAIEINNYLVIILCAVREILSVFKK